MLGDVASLGPSLAVNDTSLGDGNGDAFGLSLAVDSASLRPSFGDVAPLGPSLAVLRASFASSFSNALLWAMALLWSHGVFLCLL